MLYLASQSPRRHELLRQLGYDFSVLDVDVPEYREPGETADGYVNRVAREKAGAGLLKVAAVPNAIVIGADTEVILDDEVFGKPADAADAAAMLRRLSGRSHLVLTGVCLIGPGGGQETAVASTQVEFRPLTGDEIDRYVASGEPMDKAGAYAIQGGAGGFVTRIDGEYDNVVGLPVALVQAMCRAARIQVS